MGLFGKKGGVLQARHAEWVGEARGLVAELRKAFDYFGDDMDRKDAKELLDASTQLGDLFLVVVAGEFNSGKSALVNALLGERVLTEGVTPTTDRIHVLRHGERPEEREIEAFVLEKRHPSPLLEELSFVDTPGTNAIMRQHEALTARFVPRSDLVLFVTSADRPFTESERSFLEEIRAWGKKIIFIVNKVDILAPGEVDEVVAFVRTHGKELIGSEPPIYPVSARLGLEARERGSASDWAQSGMEAVVSFLTETLDENERVRLKLLNPIGVALRLLQRYLEVVKHRFDVLDSDMETLRVVDQQLSGQRIRLRERFEEKVKPVCALVDDLEVRGVAFFEREIRLSNVLNLVDSKFLGERFKTEVVGDLDQALESEVQRIVDWLVEQQLSLWQDVDAYLNERKLDRYQDRMAGSVGRHFEYNRRAVADSVLRAVNRAAGAYNRDVEAAQLSEDIRDSLTTTALVEAGAVGLGAILVAVLATAAADVTGIFLATAVAAGGFYILPSRRRKVIRAFREKVGALRENLVQKLGEQVETEVASMVDQVNSRIAPYERFIRHEFEKLNKTRSVLQRIEEGLVRLKRTVEKA